MVNTILKISLISFLGVGNWPQVSFGFNTINNTNHQVMLSSSSYSGFAPLKKACYKKKR